MEISEYDQRVLDGYRYADNVPANGLTIDGQPALTRIDPSKVARYVLMMVRDPLCAYDQDATADIAKYLDDVEVTGASGMFTTITGSYRGVPVTVVSGGSGGPEAELALMDFFEHTDADTYIRVGGSGGMHESVRPGDLVIAKAAVRSEGLTQAYAPLAYPAVADAGVVSAMTEAARRLDVPYHVGLTRSTDSDFVSSGRPAAGGFLPMSATTVLDQWRRLGVLNGDRETAAIITLASIYGHRGGSVCSVADNIVTGEKFLAGAGHASAIEVSLEGLVELHRIDALDDQPLT